MGDYKIKCLKTGDIFDDSYVLHYTEGALIIADYAQTLKIKENLVGVWRFSDWLPTEMTNSNLAGTITYKAERLGEELGLTNLWITFHGYWPEKGGLCPTGTFKDLEAVPTIQRMRDHNCSGMICASAGNTARAFVHYCGKENFPLIVVVGGIHAHRIWTTVNKKMGCVKVVVVEDGDYFDAKMVAKKLDSKLKGWQLEGGAHNIARRDGIGTLILDAFDTIGKMPDHYFQGVGGGPGPIGVKEMMERLVNFGIHDGPIAKIHLSQNPEHCPIHNAWQAERTELVDSDFPVEEVDVYSDYLLNQSPAYSIRGGVHDVLKDSNGHTYVVSRDDAIAAQELFEEIEGIDILSPAAVAFGSLIQAIEKKTVGKDDCIVLNISGGGINRMHQDFAIRQLDPWISGKKDEIVERILSEIQD